MKLSAKFSLSLERQVFDELESIRGEYPRSTFLNAILREYLREHGRYNPEKAWNLK